MSQIGFGCYLFGRGDGINNHPMRLRGPRNPTCAGCGQVPVDEHGGKCWSCELNEAWKRQGGGILVRVLKGGR